MIRPLALVLTCACVACTPERVVPEPGYSAAFRATLANPAPAEQAEGERIYYEETFGTEVLDDWPSADWMIDLWQGDEATWGEQFSAYGWLVDPGDDLPVGLKRGTSDATKVHETCAACHVDVLPDGRIWGGMPATKLQWSQFRLAIDEAWVADGGEPLLSPESIDHMRAVPQPGSSNAESSDSDVYVPTDFPLYANLGLRDNLGYTGAGGDARSQVWLSIFTFGAGASEGGVPFPDAGVTRFFDPFMAWMTTPDAPPGDAAAIDRGRAVFESSRCDACHHPGDLLADDVPDWIDISEEAEALPGENGRARGSIGTDYSFYSLSDGALDGGGGPGPGLLELIAFIAANNLDVGQTSGYVAADLHGLWATAPYLHNGSVPTLQALLSPPAQRPATFEREGFTVDTAAPGMSNVGHTFGTDLPQTDKDALVAYLESL